MPRIAVMIFTFFLASTCLAAEQKRYELKMSLNDTFIVEETKEWDVDVERILTLRFANVNITPKNDNSFDMQLFFKCDTPDLAKFDSPDKIKKSVISSSKQYLPYSVETEIEVKELNVKGWYGSYTILTDIDFANKTKIPEGEFKYMTRGMVRLSPDSVLGFSFMTNEIDSEIYKKLFDYIKGFVKEK